MAKKKQEQDGGTLLMELPAEALADVKVLTTGFLAPLAAAETEREENLPPSREGDWWGPVSDAPISGLKKRGRPKGSSNTTTPPQDKAPKEEIPQPVVMGLLALIGQGAVMLLSAIPDADSETGKKYRPGVVAEVIPFTPAQCDSLAPVVSAVLSKYFPAGMGKYKEELALLLVLAAVAQAKYQLLEFGGREERKK